MSCSGFWSTRIQRSATAPACSDTEASPYSTWQGLELPDLFDQPFPGYLCPVRRQGPEATNSQPCLEPLLRPTSKPELRNCSLFTGNTASWAASCRCLPQRPVQPDLGPPRDCPCVFQNVSRSCVPCPFIFRENEVRQPPPPSTGNLKWRKNSAKVPCMPETVPGTP